jgi:hypothetical protein
MWGAAGSGKSQVSSICGLVSPHSTPPDPLVQAQFPAPQAVSAAVMDSASHSQMNS